MTRIYNNFSYGVIQADNGDPYVSWANHEARGSDGGVDLAYPYGQSVRANADGNVERNSSTAGSGGRSVSLTLPDGRKIEYLHLSGFKASAGEDVKAGDVIAYSGGSADGSENGVGAHLHVHMMINGQRKNIFDYFSVETPEDDVPDSFVKSYSVDQNVLIADYGTLKYAAAAPDRTISPGADFISATVNLAINGLAAGQRVYGRFIILRDNSPLSFGPVTFEGTDVATTKYFETSMNARLNTELGDQLRFQVKASATGVTVSEYRVHALSWSS